MKSEKPKTWSGRFNEPVAELVKRYTASVSFDQRLAEFDIQGSLAHARMLGAQGITVSTLKEAAEFHAAGFDDIITCDMGGTSFDIGIVVEGGVKHYDFNPIIERWMVSVPMVHLVTLGAGGGSICRFDRMFQTVQVGPESAGSDPGPACYDRGGMNPTVTDADLLLGYLDPANYAGGHISLNPRRARHPITISPSAFG